MAKRALLWGTGKNFCQSINYFLFLEKMGLIEICGITSNDVFYSSLVDKPFINKKDITVDEYDIVIVMSKGTMFVKMQEEILKYGFDVGIIIPYFVFQMYGFSIEKYCQIKNNPPSIIAPNCWGGITYNSLGLRFESPFINMWISHEDYIKMLQNIKSYLEKDLVFYKFEIDRFSKEKYPVALCGDIYFHFNHSNTFEEANSSWIKRKSRFNYNNIFVMMFSENKYIANEFLKIPHRNKMCFTSFPLNDNAIHYVKGAEKIKDVEFWKLIIDMAYGRYLYYDIFELLLNNQVDTKASFD